MKAQTTHLEHVAGVSVPVCGDTHTGQSFVGDFVRTCRSISYYLNMRGVSGLSTSMIGHGQLVATNDKYNKFISTSVNCILKLKLCIYIIYVFKKGNHRK